MGLGPGSVEPGGLIRRSPSSLYQLSTMAPMLISSLPPGWNVHIEPSPPSERCTATQVPRICCSVTGESFGLVGVVCWADKIAVASRMNADVRKRELKIMMKGNYIANRQC